MAAGLVRRYREAGAAPPSVMYVDRDRCSPQARGQAQVAAMFSAWTSGALCVGLQQAASRRLTGSTAPSWRRWPGEGGTVAYLVIFSRIFNITANTAGLGFMCAKLHETRQNIIKCR
uniref:PPUP8942 n=1 Tax=Poeciliopsis prolifica TaxID=188132 RepID=A0A0S7EJR6_9TELE